MVAIWGIQWLVDLSAWLEQWITPLSQCIILVFYIRARSKWKYRGRVAYREENWVKKTYSRVSFKTVWFFPIWLLFCWLASENTWYMISYLYLAQLLLGMHLPRIEYRITQNTPEGWALREYARKEFNEEKLEQRFYTQLYQAYIGYKKHEYYWWWQMKDERWIFRIKAFSQFTRDIIFSIVILSIAIILLIFYLPIRILWYPKFSMEWLAIMDIFFTTYGLIVIYAWLYLLDSHYYKYHAWNYFFYYKKYRAAAGPCKEKPGTWEYYYYILTGVFPEKYRDLQDEAHRKLLAKLGLKPSQDDDIDAEEEGEDDLYGFSSEDIDDYDAEGGLDLTEEFNTNISKDEDEDEDFEEENARAR